MFCPKCATQNIDGASFCRACGANVGLVQQALAGELTNVSSDRYDRPFRRRGQRCKRQPSVAEGIQGIFTGVGFVIVSFLVGRYAPAGELWWYWLLIPAFTMMGKGVADIVRARQLPSAMQLPSQSMMPDSVRRESMPAANTGRLVSPPPSVTEGTTRHLGVEAQTKHFDSANEFRNKAS